MAQPLPGDWSCFHTFLPLHKRFTPHMCTHTPSNYCFYSIFLIESRFFSPTSGRQFPLPPLLSVLPHLPSPPDLLPLHFSDSHSCMNLQLLRDLFSRKEMLIILEAGTCACGVKEVIFLDHLLTCELRIIPLLVIHVSYSF